MFSHIHLTRISTNVTEGVRIKHPNFFQIKLMSRDTHVILDNMVQSRLFGGVKIEDLHRWCQNRHHLWCRSELIVVNI